LRKIELSPLVITPVILAVAAGSFLLGGATGGRVPSNLNFLKPVRAANFSSLNDIYGLMQRDFDGQIDDQKAPRPASSRPAAIPTPFISPPARPKISTTASPANFPASAPKSV
jgi:hypothetical protein